MPVFDETVTWHVIRPEDLNHHGTLFAGKMSMWVVEAGLIAASRLVSRPEDIVCVLQEIGQ
jgi:acyl-CoA hydrolase